MRVSNQSKTNTFLFLSFAVLFGLAFLRVHMRVQTTLIGYELGKLKQQESSLLEEKSQLQMTYAKITGKEYLSVLSRQPESEIKDRNPLVLSEL